MDADNTFRSGRDLAAERVRRGLLQRDVAAALGVSARRVSQIESRPRVGAGLAARYLAGLRLAPLGGVLSAAVADLIEDLAAALDAPDGAFT